MDLIIDSVKKSKFFLKDSGCEEGWVMSWMLTQTLVYCQFDKGACMAATFGGGVQSLSPMTPSGQRQKSRLCSMQPSTHLQPGAAACSMVNVAAGFFCLSRILHSCPESSHTECLKQLEQEMGKKESFAAVACLLSKLHSGIRLSKIR